MNNPKICVVVPVYKVEKYLRECVDSILNQTFTEFQVILVDDGSPDACGAICDDYAEKDNRVKVLHKINGGVSSGRNSGVNQFIGGRYLTFVDSDDTIPPTAFADMWAEVENHPGVDVVCGQVELEGKAWMDFSGLPDFIDDRQYLSKHYFQSVLPGIVVGKLIRHELYQNIGLHFEEGIISCEDTLWGHELYKYINSLVHCRNVVYHYRVNEDSVTHNVDLTLNYTSILDTAVIAARQYDKCMSHMENMFLYNQLSFGMYQRCYEKVDKLIVGEHIAKVYSELKKMSIPITISNKFFAWRLTLSYQLATSKPLVFLNRIIAWTVYHPFKY